MYRRIIQKYKERKILQSIFMGSFGISTLCIIIACMIGFAWFERTNERESIEKEQRELSNYLLVLDNYIRSAQDTLELLYKNVYVRRLLYSEDITWNDNMSVVANNVLNTVSVNPRLHSIYIFGNDEILLKSSNHAYPLTSSQDEIMKENFQVSSLRHYNLMQYQDIYGKNKELLSISTGEFSKETMRFINGVMVSLDIGAIADEIFTNVITDESFLIVDTNLNVLGRKGGGYEFNQSLSGNSMIEVIKKDGKIQNTIKYNTESGEIYIVSYVYSRSDGYYIIHSLPYKSFVLSIQKTRLIVIVTGVVMAFIALTISFLVALKVYHPIDEVVDSFMGRKDKFDKVKEKAKINEKQKDSGKLKDNKKQEDLENQRYNEKLKDRDKENRKKRSVNELSTLSQTMTSMVSQLNQLNEKKEQQEITQYLTSKSADAILPEHILELYEGREESIKYQVIALRICDVDDFLHNNTKEAIAFQLQTISNMAGLQLHDYGELKTIIMDSEYIAIILIIEDDLDQAVLKDEVQKILMQVDNILSIKLDAGISELRNSLYELREAYQSARAATSYRFLYGMNVVVSEKQMQQSALGGKVTIDTKGIMEAVKSRNQELFINRYQDMTKSLRGYSIQAAYDLLVSLAIDMYKYQKDLTKHSSEVEISEIEAVRAEVMSFHYIEDATSWFIDLFGSISAMVSKVQNSGSADIVSNSIRYIEENYMDINISAQFLASKYNITPSYFSRIFNEVCNCAFPDYLSGYRLEKAKQILLNSPNKSIQTICEEVGYTSSSYFTAMFKKKYGVTPSKFRSTMIQ